MIGLIVIAVGAMTAVKLFFALCGHRITWRLAAALLVLVVLYMTAHSTR